MAPIIQNMSDDHKIKEFFPSVYNLFSSPHKEGKSQRICVTRIGLVTNLKCLAIIDVVQFFQQQAPVFKRGLKISELSTAVTESASATLFIVEDVNKEFIDHLRRHCQHSDSGEFELQCLDDFLDASPVYVYADIEPQLPVSESMAASQQHLSVQSVSAREFDHYFPLEEEVLDDKSYWPNGRVGGILYPIQLRNAGGSGAPFPPVVVIEQRFTAWFDAKGKAWRTGVIFVDRPFQPRDLPKFRGLRCAPSAGTRIDTRQSHRFNLLLCMEGNATLSNTTGVPAPFVVLQDTYKLVVSEWMTTVTYFARDLNTIQWSLEGRTGNDWTTPEEFEGVLKKLYAIRRRLSRYRMLVGQQLMSCGKCGQASWDKSESPGSKAASVIAKVSVDLQLDFVQTLELIERNLDLAEHSIRLLTSLMSILHGRLGIEEHKRSVSQNKILTVLTFVATFFLPVNAISAIFNMQGDWAPLQPNFGIFWAITIPISTFLVILLLVFKFFNHLPAMMWRGPKWRTGSASGVVTV